MADRTPQRRVRYQVAASLDGYVAGPKGEADWIPMDPDIDFSALFGQFDTLLMGRRDIWLFGGGDLFRSLAGQPRDTAYRQGQGRSWPIQSSTGSLNVSPGPTVSANA
jgi:hypothetical protein